MTSSNVARLVVLLNSSMTIQFISNIWGVLPLVLASGAGAASRHSICTGVFGGMLAATFLAIFFVPLFFVIAGNLSQMTK